MKVIAVIPARYSSTRLPGKVLLKETGKYIIQHTYEQARLAKLPERVIIAADDEKIILAAKSFGAECILTSPDHQSGTDRIAEVIKKLPPNPYPLSPDDIVVNVQGDEPEIDPANIDKVAKLLVDNPDYPMATLAAPFERPEDIANPNIVKVVVSSCVVRDEYRVKQTQYTIRNTQYERAPLLLPLANTLRPPDRRNRKREPIPAAHRNLRLSKGFLIKDNNPAAESLGKNRKTRTASCT